MHTTLAGTEPTTFQLLVRRATSSATDSHFEHPWSIVARSVDGDANEQLFDGAVQSTDTIR